MPKDLEESEDETVIAMLEEESKICREEKRSVNERKCSCAERKPNVDRKREGIRVEIQNSSGKEDKDANWSSCYVRFLTA